MTPTPVRWGILGAAGINSAMVPALQVSEYSEVVAIASRTAERAIAAAEQFVIPRAIEGYDALLADSEIEAVYIPLPNSLHCEWVVKAAKAGKHVLCEKPMAVTEEEARSMVDACDSAGVLLAEAFMYAHHPRYERLREILDSGEIGAVRSIITTFSFDASEELEHSGFQGYPGSGAIYDVGCYALHSARFLLRSEPVAITAHSGVSETHGQIDMSTSALAEFPGGVALLFHVSMWGADTDTIEIIGSAGRILVPHAFICGVDDGDFDVIVGETRRTEAVPRLNHYVVQADTFSRAVREGTPLLYGHDDPIHGVAALETALLSSRESRRIPLG